MITSKQTIPIGSETVHALRAPLTTIRLYTEALMTGVVGKASAEQLEYLKDMYNATTNMAAQLDELSKKIHGK